jgi:hypothetical protein
MVLRGKPILKPDRLSGSACDRIMNAVVTTGIGGAPGPGEVLLQVFAAGINNADINTPHWLVRTDRHGQHAGSSNTFTLGRNGQRLERGNTISSHLRYGPLRPGAGRCLRRGTESALAARSGPSVYDAPGYGSRACI